MAAYKGSGSCLITCYKKFVNLYMTAVQLKTEIQKVLDKVPEDALPDILNYLRQVSHQSPDQIKFRNNLKKIMTEDKELLERLAK